MNIRDNIVNLARFLDSRKTEDVVIINIEGRSSLADFILLGSAANERQLGAVADDTEHFLAKENILPKSVEGKKESGWILLDYGDFIINLLTEEMRDKYNIEMVWNDCKNLAWEESNE